MRYCTLLALITAACWAQNPSPDVLKQVLEKTLLSLRPEGMTERQVLFHSVVASPKYGAYYPFTVTATIRDYGTGYPPNRYYGETCVRKMENWKFNLSRDSTGDWAIDGRMTVTDSRCVPNPSAGVSSIPLASLSGARAPKGPVPGAAAMPGEQQLHIGEWACYGTGGRLLAGLGFFLQADGSYLDGDRKPSGRYVHNRAGATISFQGGMLGGQTGSKVTPRNIQLSNTVSCEPWR